MKHIIALTDATLCKEPLHKRVEALAKGGISAIILRDLHAHNYKELARDMLHICGQYGVLCVLHKYIDEALELTPIAFHCQSAQIPHLPYLREYVQILGVSVHSIEEYKSARKWVDYVIAGHIFPSSCKAHLAPHGLALLQDIIALECLYKKRAFTDPSPHAHILQGVYAIGGITLENLRHFNDVAIAGVCMREALMIEKDLKHYIKQCFYALHS